MNLPSEAFLRQQAIQARCFHPSGEWTEFPRSALDGSIVARFEEMVARYPERLAVKMDDVQLTYAKLNQAANQVAHAILQATPEPPLFVALLLDHSLAAVVAILAVLKAGAAYLPLDPTFPVPRNHFILEDVQTTLVVTNSRNWALAGMLSNGQHCLLNMDETDPKLSWGNPNQIVGPDALCNLLYTSGSTGQPKGVMQNHRNMLHCILQNSNYLHICAEDRYPLFSSYSTVSGAYSIFCALLNGAALFPYTMQEKGVVNLAQWLNQEAITFCDLVPTAFRQIVNDPSNEQRFPHLRVLYLGGERVDPQDVAAYKRSLEPTAILVTGFAATETCSEVCLMLIDKATELTENVVPLGYALPNMTIYLLDEAAQVVGSNQIGEIAVKSPYLALGYWQRPELTQARFLPDASDRQQRIYLTGDLGLLRDDGALIHKGRKDFQLKIRGNRVDIGEIEATLLALSWVKQAVVTSILYESGECALIAYLVPQQAKPTVAQIRKALAERLPSYMIPAKFVFLAALPLTVTGKIDRTALPAAQDARPDLGRTYVAPRTPIEMKLVAIWEEILALAPVGIDDPFLELGGHSLHAMQVHARLVNEWPIDFPLQQLFACATIAELALWIAQQQAAQLSPEMLAEFLAALEATEQAKV